MGYTLSPFLAKTIRRGLSAGRVQSVAVRMIVDREEEIRAFVPQEYWTIDAKLTAPPQQSRVRRRLLRGRERGDQTLLQRGDRPGAGRAGPGRLRGGPGAKGEEKSLPGPPFITSTLQQEASRKLGFQARRTMKAAQELYEGVDVEGLGSIGLITYMRTDSLRISEDAIRDAGEYIENRWGKKYLPSKPRHFKSRPAPRTATRPSAPPPSASPPDQVKNSLTSDQYKLYKLIWERFIACQMANCVLNTTQATIPRRQVLVQGLRLQRGLRGLHRPVRGEQG